MTDDTLGQRAARQESVRGALLAAQEAQLADLTAHGLSPEAWARRVAEAAAQYGASRVVAEKNQGGDMIVSDPGTFTSPVTSEMTTGVTTNSPAPEATVVPASFTP